MDWRDNAELLFPGISHFLPGTDKKQHYYAMGNGYLYTMNVVRQIFLRLSSQSIN